MNLLLLLEKHLVIGISAAAAMHVLISRQQDLGLETTPDNMKKRAQETASAAVVFANALWDELSQRGS